ncbi:hypothetical protein EVAR_5328_1 [Eumeta japonica]|uniref:Uncharacterized protein n=1 Tax=Eumeta variegata TaxID=151549 RepID=A0A4C1TN88_EUMVA|nr:hypothetical protein EVAR_5328_1 [Eumeta japonica]
MGEPSREEPTGPEAVRTARRDVPMRIRCSIIKVPNLSGDLPIAGYCLPTSRFTDPVHLFFEFTPRLTSKWGLPRNIKEIEAYSEETEEF